MSSSGGRVQAAPSGATEDQNFAGDERPAWAILEIYMARLLKSFVIEERGQRYRSPTDVERWAIRGFIDIAASSIAEDFWPEDATLPLAAATPSIGHASVSPAEGRAGTPATDELNPPPPNLEGK